MKSRLLLNSFIDYSL